MPRPQAELTTSTTRSTRIGARPLVGSDRQHLLLAAGEGARRARGHLAELRQQLQNRRHRRLAALGPGGEAAELEVLGDAQVGEDVAALEHMAEAHPRPVGGGDAA